MDEDEAKDERGIKAGAEAAAKDLNVKLLYDGPTEPDPAKQNEIVETWITRGVDVIAALRMVEGRPVLDVRGGPGTLYLLQRTTSLTPPIQWTPLVTVEAPGDGRFEFTDPVPPGAGPAFYRVVRP